MTLSRLGVATRLFSVACRRRRCLVCFCFCAVFCLFRSASIWCVIAPQTAGLACRLQLLVFYFLFFSSCSCLQQLQHKCGFCFLFNSDASLLLPSLWKEINRRHLQSGVNGADTDRFIILPLLIAGQKDNSNMGSTSLNLQLFKAHLIQSSLYSVNVSCPF